MGSCVRLFSSNDCNGSPLMAVRPGSACHSSWSVCGLTNNVKSIGGCLPDQYNISGQVLDIIPLSVSSGRIASPNYPKNYNNSIEVNWIITTLPEQKIEIKFTNFAIENDSTCSFDRVTSTEFNSQEVIFEGCGNKIPPPIISRSNQVILKFKSDASTTKKGFSLDWESCTGCQSTNSIRFSTSGLSPLIPISQFNSTTVNTITQVTSTICISEPLQKALIRIGRVSFHTGKFFSGNSYSDNITPGCHEMPIFFRRNVGSLNDACKVICLYSEKNCDGECISTEILDRNTQLSNLTRIGWGNKVTSWKPSLKGITC